MIKKILILIVFSILIHSCQTKECRCDSDIKVLAENDSIINSFNNSPRSKEYWSRFDEPLLYLQNKEVYRFSYRALPTDLCKMYRIEKNDNNYNLYIKEYSVREMVITTLKNSYSRAITEKEWLTTVNTIRGNCFWTMPCRREEDSHYLDGTWCLVEGFNPEKNNCTHRNFHAVSRLDLGDTTNFTKICNTFEDLERKK